MLDLRKEDLDAAIQRQLERSRQRQEGLGRPAADQRDVQMCAKLLWRAHPEARYKRGLLACGHTRTEITMLSMPPSFPLSEAGSAADP